MTQRLSLACPLSLALLGAAAMPAAAQPNPPVAQVGAGSEIAFMTKQMGVPVEGRFGNFTAQIALDPKKPENGSVSFTIDTGSARFVEVVPGEEGSEGELCDAVRMALEKDPLVDAGQLQVTSRGSAVTLTGVVPSWAQRLIAERDAWLVFGVDEVLNRIAVRA